MKVARIRESWRSKVEASLGGRHNWTLGDAQASRQYGQVARLIGGGSRRSKDTRGRRSARWWREICSLAENAAVMSPRLMVILRFDL